MLKIRQQRQPKVAKRKAAKATKRVQKKSIRRNITSSAKEGDLSLNEAFAGPRGRSYRKFIQEDKPAVGAEVIKRAYDVTKFGATAFNCSPLRFKVLDTAELKEQFVPALLPGNEVAVRDSPLTVVFAFDSEFNKHFDFLSPNYDGAGKYYAANPDAVVPAAKLNANLQAGYMISALKLAGYSLGPASGFDPEKTDALFFANDEKSKSWRSFMYVNVGYGDDASLFPRAPRFNFDDVSV